jgi:hypothetical protein
LWGCEEVEHQTLITTELRLQTDSIFYVKGSIADVAEGELITGFGHCWSDTGIPTINGDKTSFEGALTLDANSFESAIDDFVSNRTYYFRTYVRYASGEVEYGNELTVNTGLTQGRWEKVSDFWLASSVRRNNWDCGEYTVEIIKFGFLMNAGFYQEKVIAGNGYCIQGVGAVDFENNEICEDETFDGFNMAFSTLDFKNPFFRLLQNDKWSLASPVINDHAGFGGIGIVDGNFLYTGASAVTNTQGLGTGIYAMYFNSEGDLGFIDTDLKVYDIQNNVWKDLAPLPERTNLYASSFLIGDKIFLVSGVDASYNFVQTVWEYNISNDSWMQKSDFPGDGRMHSVSFVINGKAYVGSGFGGAESYEEGDLVFHWPESPLKDFWEYTPESDTWKRVGDLPGPGRGAAFGFSVQGNGYIGCGSPGLYEDFLTDFWRFDPLNNNWQKLKDFPGGARYGASGFANNTHGAVGFGFVGRNILEPAFKSDLWYYDPTRN